MKTIALLMLAAGFLPLLATILAKAGGQQYDNRAPRAWLARQDGWRARANAAQQNAFEALPLFYGAVLFALINDAAPERLATLMLGWLVLRLAYLAAYLRDLGAVRSLCWAGAFALSITILFIAV